ncbi:hypothetical protein P4H39_04995 [Paenibacillus lautus]|uniref:hypothetical protein n=1 Tax=Paenibacillus lautus TaxID=1401 RepID=UPI002DB82C85|nr:hypothetical protein [Paenibacillus lautus]MEC0201979.1 hypothetical protein [Paenibacillus lautus]
MKKTRSVLYVILLIVMFGTGYYVGSRSENLKPISKDNARQAIQTLWVKSAEPPLPKVSIDGTEIKLQRGGYSWCNRDNCATTDAAPPKLEDMTPVAVTGGADIQTTPPEGIHGFTILNQTDPDNDGYTVPAVPGSYLYEIQCTWPLDQGRASFYFAVTVL